MKKSQTKEESFFCELYIKNISIKKKDSHKTYFRILEISWRISCLSRCLKRFLVSMAKASFWVFS